MNIISDTIPLPMLVQHRIMRLYETEGKCGFCPKQITGKDDRFILLQPMMENDKQVKLTALVTCMGCAKRIEQTMSLCSVVVDPGSLNGKARP